LQTFVTAVDTLIGESDSGENATFSALDTKLTSLLTDAVGGTPRVEITPSDSDDTSNLDMLIELVYDYTRSEEVNINLADVTSSTDETVAFFTKSLIPGSNAEAGVDLNAVLTFTLAVGVEYDKTTEKISTYIKDTTGVVVSFDAVAVVNFGAAIGPFEGTVDATINVGDTDNPITLSVGLPGVETKYYLTGGGDDTKTLTDVAGDLVVSFSGSLQADVTADISSLGLGAAFDITVPDMNKALELRDSSAFETTFTLDCVICDITPPSMLNILLANPQGLVDALDDILNKTEQASLGADGIVTVSRGMDAEHDVLFVNY
jgi:hypothetical protein